MGWNYRVCRYTTKGVVLFSILEVYYAGDGEPSTYVPATGTAWERRTQP